MVGISSLLAAGIVVQSCQKEEDTSVVSCSQSPTETKGPFPIKTPAELVKASIIGDREGLALLINIVVQSRENACAPLEGVYVDVWHCDADGNYSEYGGTNFQTTNYTNAHFLRGRQTTDANGTVSFLSIFPGWYSGRAPHIHVEILNAAGSSLLVTQIAFPEDVSEKVYASEQYKGSADTSNKADNVFSDSLEENMADTITGNNTDGYTLSKTIVV